MLPSLLLIKLLTLLSVSPYATPFSIRSVGTCVLCQPHASSTLKAGSTLYDKIYAEHLIPSSSDKEFTPLIYIDRHLIHEVTSPQAFEGLRLSNRKVRRPDCTLATVDHNVPTSDRKQLLSVEDFISETQSKTQVLELEKNVDAFSLKYFGLGDSRQGIVHIIGPEQGFTLPGSTVVCGDSHTATHGAFGALAFGIGTSEVEHVLATQTLEQTKSKNMLIEITGTISPSVKSKDIVLHICGVIGTAGGTGCAIEFGGEGVRALSMEARMSISNMAIEAGARAGLIAPDETTFEYLKGRPMSPSPGREWDEALEHWRTLKSDPDAKWDKVVTIKAEDIEPSITWGTSPQDVVNINGKVPTTESSSDPARQAAITRSLDYIGLSPGGMPIKGVPIDKVFIGSCTNGRIEDLRDVAAIALGRKVKEGVDAMIVPGSGLVKRQAEKEGLDKIFAEAGFDFREPGCSMCLAMNDDKLKPQERCASTSNRNFEGRQGDGGRTHLVSPMMAAAAAIKGAIDDVREYEYLGDESNDPRRFNSRTDRGSDTFTTEVLVNPGPIINENDEICEDIEEKKIVDGDCEPVSSGLPKFTVLTGKAAPLDIQNVDTDMIIPKEFLKTIKRSGLGFAAFAELRYTNALAVATIGEEVADERKEFILNTDPYKGKAKILIAGDNFGCGSSREHAPWAINDMGLRCIISNSFADIFYNNCLNNGMLPIKLSRPEVEELLEIAGDPDNEITVNLPDQVVITKTNSYKFEIDQFKKFCLVNGLDKIGLTLERIADIRKFEEKRSKERPYFDGAAMKAPDEVKMYENAPIWSVQTGVGAP